MIKQILKQIWNERRSNAWLWAELLLVSIVLWVIVDWGYVMLRIYLQPHGFNIENTYQLYFDELNLKSSNYVPADRKTTTFGEDFLATTERLRHHPDVEFVGIAQFSSPYNGSNSSHNVTHDTLPPINRLFRWCTPDFFNVFQYENVDGSGSQSLADALKANTLIVGSNFWQEYYPDGKGLKGLSFYSNDDSTAVYTISAITKPVRYSDFRPITDRSYFASLLEEKDIIEMPSSTLSSVEVCIRVHSSTSPDFAEQLMKDSPRLYNVGNCYIQRIRSFEDVRSAYQLDEMNELKTRGYIVFFLLVNIFLGIIGTFWFRTRQRQGELGLRLALGSTADGLKRLLINEGVLLLTLAFIPAVIICINIGYADLMQVWQMEWGIARFVPGILITFVLMALMIVAGIWIPAQRAMKIQPAEALHEE
ncbi:putative ABC transport system permease protein [termite gut metagenome]|uniref:Putative ABC transport system permease protein n=1 Tax=termite gut metagenome TaxID=433724 RepID=A0A5J4RMW0_9ZZZZ